MEAIKGAIIGDIVGSRYEFNNIKTKDFELFGKGCSITDDTVMTIAIADATKNCPTKDGYIDTLKKWAKKYPDAGYGFKFYHWVLSDDRKPYNSFGNGSAMRISAVADNIDINKTTLEALKELKEKVLLATEITHNHPEGIKGALATADLIWFCKKWRKERHKLDIEWLKNYIEDKYEYNLSIPLNTIRKREDMESLNHSESCQTTVPIAIRAVIEVREFEDCIRNAVSVGGDSDTIAAIAGSIAGAYFGVPENIWIEAKKYLPLEMEKIIKLYDE